LPLLLGNLLHWHQRPSESGAVNQNIDFAQAPYGLVHHGVYLTVIRAIRDDSNRPPAFSSNFLSHSIELWFHLFKIHQNNARTFACKSVGDGLANATGAAYHNRYLAIQFHHGSSGVLYLFKPFKTFGPSILSP